MVLMSPCTASRVARRRSIQSPPVRAVFKVSNFSILWSCVNSPAFRCKLFDYLTKEREDLAVESSACAHCKMFQVSHSQENGTRWLGYEVPISEWWGYSAEALGRERRHRQSSATAKVRA